jgi:hypothetical protein
MSFIRDLGAAWLRRHANDPSSWTGLVVELLTAFHIKPDQGLVGNLDNLCIALVGIALFFFDARKNPNTDDSTGAISVRPAPPTTADVPPAAGSAGLHVPHVDRTDDVRRTADGSAVIPPQRPGFDGRG